MSKAKACEEMIFYERPFSPQTPQTTSPINSGRTKAASNPLEFPAPSEKVLAEFAGALTSYIRDTTLSEDRA